MLERHGCLLGHGPSELGSTPRPSNVEPSTPTPKRRRGRNLQDAPSNKKGLEHLNPHSLGEQYLLGVRPGMRTRLCCIVVYLLEGMEGRMPLASGGQERGHVYPVQCM